MPRGKKFTAEQIIGKLREAEVGLAAMQTLSCSDTGRYPPRGTRFWVYMPIACSLAIRAPTESTSACTTRARGTKRTTASGSAWLWISVEEVLMP